MENLRTLADIIITVHENIRPRRSKMSVSIMGVVEMENRFHSKSILELYNTVDALCIRHRSNRSY